MRKAALTLLPRQSAVRCYEGAAEEGIKPHKLADSPADVDDDGQFRLVILGADYAGIGDPPLAKAQEFLRTHSSPADVRTYQNIVLVVTPSVTESPIPTPTLAASVRFMMGEIKPRIVRRVDFTAETLEQMAAAI
jgi:hypothetical protein